MKAIRYATYGPPEVLELREVEQPRPKERQVLLKVRAAAANPLDWHSMRGSPFIVRLAGGLRSPKDQRLGADVAGTVAAVGAAVAGFQPGDEVFGTCAGAFAEYACAGESSFALKPGNVTFEQAAAAPVAAFTALQGLRDAGRIKAGDKVLVNGASGGVGTFAVQIAKSFGCEVTGVCSAGNLGLVRSIGADHAVDYAAEDFTRAGRRYDLVFCAVGNRSAAAYARALLPGGRCVIAGFTSLWRMAEQSVLGPVLSLAAGRKVGGMGIATPNRRDLDAIRELLASGTVKSVIDRQYPLTETGTAIRYLEQGHARGKVIISIS